MSIIRQSWIEVTSMCCKGGGGGGGSTSGSVDYPDYIKLMHTNLLTGATVVDTANTPFDASTNLFTAIDAAVATSPYSGEDAYDPDSDIAIFVAALAVFSGVVSAFDDDWSTYSGAVDTAVDDIYSETDVDAVTDAHADILDDRLTTDVLPRFQAGMRDINAVISSSFTIGQSVLEAFNTREVAEFDAKLRMQNYGMKIQLIGQGVKDSIGLQQLKLQFNQEVSRQTIEAYRIKVVMKKEEIDEHLDILDNDYRWGIELYQYGSNAIGAVAGSAVGTGKTPSKFNSVLGGAMSGAAAGGMIGGPIGAGVGAVVGGIGSLFG